MTRKMRSYVKGLILSLCGKPLPLTAKKEPVAYLYNGVRLPKLPEYDKSKYPYAVIYQYNSKCLFLVFERRPYCSNIEKTAGTDYRVFLYGNRTSWIKENDAFVDPRTVDDYKSGTDGHFSSGIVLIWTNFDLIDDNGDVYIAAGYTNYPDAPPVLPVTEAADPCPDKSVMYLYDNAATDEVGDTVMLPAIPEIDRRVYPYFALCSQGKRSTFGSDPEWMAVASRYPLNEYVSNDRYRHHVYCFIDETDSTKWGQWVKDEGSHGPLEGCNVDAWANHDVYDYDGNRVISASEPIPVCDKE